MWNDVMFGDAYKRSNGQQELKGELTAQRFWKPNNYFFLKKKGHVRIKKWKSENTRDPTVQLFVSRKKYTPKSLARPFKNDARWIRESFPPFLLGGSRNRNEQTGILSLVHNRSAFLTLLETNGKLFAPENRSGPKRVREYLRIPTIDFQGRTVGNC